MTGKIIKQKTAIMCTSSAWGGLEMNLVKLCAWLKEAGIPCDFLAAEGTPIHKALLKKKLTHTVIPKHKKYFDLRNARKTARIIKKENTTNLIISHNRDVSAAGFIKAMLGGRLNLIYQQQMQIGVDKKHILHTRRFRHIDHWIAPLEKLAKEAGEKTKMDKNKISISPLGVDVEKFSKHSVTKDAARYMLGLPTDTFIAGMIGRIDKNKKQDLLIRAVAELPDDVHCLIAGEPTAGEGLEYHNKLLSLIKDNDMNDRTHMIPFLKEPVLFFRAVDVFVMGTNGETYGMVTVEALASGTPVIGSRSGGTTEILDDGKYGLLFEPDNARDLAEKIAWCRKNAALLEKQKSERIQRARHYSKEKEMEGWMQVLR